MNNKYHNNTNVLLWSIFGTISSFFIFMFIFNFIGDKNIEGAILAGTVTICVTICYCTGKLLDSINK